MPDGSDIKRGRKFDQVLEGARDVFMTHGFEGASVDDIARAAGVSKATLYSYFPDKQLLFLEVASAECRRQAEMAIESLDFSGPVRDLLFQGARQLVDFFTTDFARNMFRICVAESARFPEIGKAFYESGPGLVDETLEGFLRCAVAEGRLAIPEEDISLAASQFHMLCKATLFHRQTFNIETEFSREEKDRVISSAVDVFMAMYDKAPG